MDKLRQQKLDMWNKKLLELEKELKKIMVQKGEAAADGDLSENAAYKQAVEDADVCRVRINEVKKILANLEQKGDPSTRSARSG